MIAASKLTVMKHRSQFSLEGWFFVLCGFLLAGRSVSNRRYFSHRSPNFSCHCRRRPPPDHPIFTALCLCPSATDPTPLTLLLITKAQPKFDSSFDRPVEAFFCVFLRSNQVQFQPSFSVFTVRSAEGRNFQGAARRINRRASNCHRSCRRPKAKP